MKLKIFSKNCILNKNQIKMLYLINKKIISFRNKSIKYVVIFILLFFFVTVVTSAQSNGTCGVMAGGMNFFTTGFGGGVLPLSNNSQACTTMNPVDFNAPSDVVGAATSLNANPSSYRPGGAIGLLAQVGEYSMSSVADSKDAVTFIANHVNPNTVSAQSSALQGLAPILVLWGITRNLCYILIAIALVVTGLVLYFANRAGGKPNNNTVLGVMVSEVVATLIFITLSYPIGAIVVDLVINLGNAVIASTLNPFINSNTILANLYAPGSGTNIISLIGDIQKVGVSGSTVNLIQSGLSYLSTPLNNASTFLTSVL
ncbi:hypothetical protein, partial [Flavobacterium sp.]|uniref:hypothetical protein n=1 Tax=Flavobacterium sp. TaxID=239 RepID=UPI003267FCD1